MTLDVVLFSSSGFTLKVLLKTEKKSGRKNNKINRAHELITSLLKPSESERPQNFSFVAVRCFVWMIQLIITHRRHFVNLVQDNSSNKKQNQIITNRAHMHVLTSVGGDIKEAAEITTSAVNASWHVVYMSDPAYC